MYNWGAIVQGAMGIGKMIAGGVKMNRGKKEQARLKKNRPWYEIPSSAQEALTLARQNTAGDMAGYNMAREDVMTGQANAQRQLQQSARGSADLVNAAAMSQGVTNDSMASLAMQNAAYKQAQMSGLVGQLGVMAGYEQQQWVWDKQQPHLRDYSEAVQQKHSGEAGIYAGAEDVAASASNFFGGNQEGGGSDFVSVGMASGGQGGPGGQGGKGASGPSAVGGFGMPSGGAAGF